MVTGSRLLRGKQAWVDARYIVRHGERSGRKQTINRKTFHNPCVHLPHTYYATEGIVSVFMLILIRSRNSIA